MMTTRTEKVCIAMSLIVIASMVGVVALKVPESWAEAYFYTSALKSLIVANRLAHGQVVTSRFDALFNAVLGRKGATTAKGSTEADEDRGEGPNSA